MTIDKPDTPRTASRRSVLSASGAALLVSAAPGLGAVAPARRWPAAAPALRFGVAAGPPGTAATTPSAPRNR